MENLRGLSILNAHIFTGKPSVGYAHRAGRDDVLHRAVTIKGATLAVLLVSGIVEVVNATATGALQGGD